MKNGCTDYAVRPFLIALVILILTTTSSSAAGSPVETGSQLSAGLWFVGAIGLGLMAAYAIECNNARLRAKKRLT